MTSATNQTAAPVSVDGAVGSEPCSPSFAVAAQLARGGAAVGVRLVGHGASAVRAAVANSIRRCEAEKETGTSPRRGRTRRIVMFAGAGAVLIAGITIWRNRRSQSAPVAARPPRVNDPDVVES